MTEQAKSGMHCSDFEAVLFEAVDGTLAPGALAEFRAHAATCAACGALFAEAEAGHRWMLALEDVEPPKNLVHNILARTSGVVEKHQAATEEPKLSWKERFLGWVRPAASTAWGTVRQPRFAMSMAMAFFSVSAALNVAGIRVSDVKKADLKPSAIKRNLYETQGRVVKYYRNIRFVYEIESRVRDLQRATQTEEQREQPKKNDKNETTRKPGTRREQQQNYFSQEGVRYHLADCPASRNVGTMKTRSVA